MERQGTQMYTVEELKEKLGSYYISKIHGKTSGMTHRAVRWVLEGKAQTKDSIIKVMEAATKAIADQEEIDHMNKQIKSKLPA